MLGRFVESDLSLVVDQHLHCLEPEKKDMNLLPIDQKGRPLNQMKVLLFFKEM